MTVSFQGCWEKECVTKDTVSDWPVNSGAFSQTLAGTKNNERVT